MSACSDAVGDEHAREHDLAGLRDAVDRRRRPPGRTPGPGAIPRPCRQPPRCDAGHRAGDLVDPDELAVEVLAPAHVVQRVVGDESHRPPHPVGDERVDGDALVGLVEVRERPALVQHARAVARGHRRALGRVQHALGEVGCRHQILEALLVLDADGVEPEVVGDPQRGDVHLRTASCTCASVSSVASSVPKRNVMPAIDQPRRRPRRPRRPSPSASRRTAPTATAAPCRCRAGSAARRRRSRCTCPCSPRRRRR